MTENALSPESAEYAAHAGGPAAPPRPRTALSIAGSDPSGGAGVQADLKTFHALGIYGMACFTALTSQNTCGVRGVHGVPADFLVSQVEAVLDDLPVDATKIGMIGAPESVEALAGLIARRRAQFGTLVLDPVMVATSGDPLLAEDAEAGVRERLLPLCDVLTPNLPEAARLLGTRPARTVAEMEDHARRLLALGPRAVLVKGGHLAEGDAVDVLALAGPGAPADGGTPSGEAAVHRLEGARLSTRNTHGTGCTLSSAIAAHAARTVPDRTGLDEQGRGAERAGAPVAEAGGSVPSGAELLAAVHSGKEFLARAVADAVGWRLSRTPEAGHGPVNHLSQTLR